MSYNAKELKQMKKTLSPYQYSKKEIGKDKSVNPNYYSDQNGNHMLMWHLSQIFPKDYTRGFLIGSCLKYIKRYRGKNGIQDLHKAMTYLKFLIKFEQDKEDFHQ